MRASLDWSGVAHMSAPSQIDPSAIHGMVSGAGRSNDSPREPYSTPVRCFTRPSRFVPVGVIGRRISYSLKPSNFDSTTARPACSFRCNSLLRSDTVAPSDMGSAFALGHRSGAPWPLASNHAFLPLDGAGDPHEARLPALRRRAHRDRTAARPGPPSALRSVHD